MDKVIVGFSRPVGWFEPFSWLIRLMTWSIFSHAYIKFYSCEFDSWLIFQASGLKVNFISQNRFDDAEFVYKEVVIPISPETGKVTAVNAMQNCGMPYAILKILGFTWVLFMRLFGKKVVNPAVGTSGFFCSELVAQVLIDIGKANNQTVDPSTMSPQDIFNFLVSVGYIPVDRAAETPAA